MKNKNHLERITCVFLFIGLLVVVDFSFFKTPRNLGLFLRYEFDWVFIVAILGYLVLANIQNRITWLLRLVFVLFLFLLPMIGLWKSGISEMQEVAGMVFFSDSARYYFDALRFLEGFQFSLFSARHPFFTSYLATFLALTGRNLRLALSMMVIINAISAFVLTELVRKIFGSLIAGFYLLFLFLFFRRFIGYPNPENIGMVLGMISLSLLFVSVYKGYSPRLAYLGLLMMTIGLCARPGMFFILPALAFWIAARHKELFWRNFFLCLLIIAIGFGLNVFVLVSTSPKDGSLFSNFSYHFYGLSKGGQGWEQAFFDHPELKTLPEGDAEEQVFSLAINEVRSHPTHIMSGIIQCYSDFFSLGDSSVFGYVSDSRSYFFGFSDVANVTALKWFRGILYLLSILGIAFLFLYRNHPLNSLLLFCVPAILFSIPFLPPRDSAMMRVYATTIPIISLYPMMGVYSLYWLFDSKKVVSNPNIADEGKFFGFASIGMLVLIMIAPTIFRHFIVPIENNQILCPANQQVNVIRLSTGSTILIIDDDLPPTNFSELNRSDYVAGLNTFYYKPIVDRLSRINPPTRMANVVNLETGLPFWVIIEGQHPFHNNEIIHMCGNWDLEMDQRGLGFFIAK